VANADRSPKEPALARVTIFEVAEREWGWLSTSAQVDDRVYVGSRGWRQQQLGHNPNIGSHRANVGSHIGELELSALSSN
jgi:hypothetical protein